ncbi:MAG: hypothetical protein GX650_05455 [Clostridiales bacterium]|nr:hypothetical protein [Clostridiales bacterium]
MALTTASIHLKADMEHLPAAAVQGLQGTPTANGWLCLTGEKLPESLTSTARRLSKAREGPVIAFFYFDEDAMCLAAFQSGKRMGQISQEGGGRAAGSGLKKVIEAMSLDGAQAKRLRQIVQCANTNLLVNMLAELLGLALWAMWDEPASLQCVEGDAAFRAYLAQKKAQPKFRRAREMLVQSFPGKMAYLDKDKEPLWITTVMAHQSFDHNFLRPYRLSQGQLVPHAEPHGYAYTPLEAVKGHPEGIPVRLIDHSVHAAIARAAFIREPQGATVLLYTDADEEADRFHLPDVGHVSLIYIGQTGNAVLCASGWDEPLALLRLNALWQVVRREALAFKPHEIRGMAAGRRRVVLVAGRQKPALHVFSLDGFKSETTRAIPGGHEPVGSIVLDAAEQHMFATTADNRVIRIALENGAVLASAPLSGSFAVVGGLDSRGRLYVWNGRHMLAFSSELEPLYRFPCKGTGGAMHRLLFEEEAVYLVTSDGNTAVWGFPEQAQINLRRIDE